MSIAKLNLLQCMEETGWPKDHVVALATFYLNLEHHPKRQEPDGDAILLTYQAQVRHEWHIQLKNTTGEPAFDISTINDDLVEKIGVKLWNITKTQLLTRSVPLLISISHLSNQILTSSLLLPLLHQKSTTFSPCYALPITHATHATRHP